MSLAILDYVGHTISLVVFFYAASAVIDAVLGLTTANMYESYLFRIASVIAIIAAYIHLTSKSRPLRPLPFVLASLVLTILAMMSGRMELATYINTAIKIAATGLTMKPEIVEIEIITEDEKEVSGS